MKNGFKSLFVALFAVFIGLTLTMNDAEARRLGGGSSFGMKRHMTTPKKNTATPNQQQAAPNAAGAKQPNRWMGPLAGLAAGLGLAALFSHLGLGEGMSNFIMILLLGLVAFAVFRFFMRKKAAASPMQYAGAGAGVGRADTFRALNGDNDNSRGGAFSPQMPLTQNESGAAADATWPADFDAENFVRHAKVNFIRLQAANDSKNLDDVRQFTTPEVFAEIKMQWSERGQDAQETDVQRLDAEVLNVVEEDQRYIVSVHFSGEISDNQAPAEPFSEIWHMVKPVNGSQGWTLAGIQQGN